VYRGLAEDKLRHVAKENPKARLKRITFDSRTAKSA